ncbi:MAG: nuclear transport factor 2 family protein, partial [Pricia sp.]|nr:nuclear transport factor 2 family protein [Pricia sp.]
VPEDTELFQLLKEKDSILFDAAFNTCNADVLENLFTPDFEFYHDKVGLTEGRERFLSPMRAKCEKRDKDAMQPSKRILVAHSLEVYPLYKEGNLYGAIQNGVHHFEFLNGQSEYQQGDIAKFSHIWIKENELWKIKRELSYDHKSQ